MMKVLQMEVGSLGTNCYIAYCENTKKAVIIDPGGDAAKILAAVSREKLSVEAIINTHGHADHVLANVKVQEATGAPLWIHGGDADMLGSGSRNLSAFLGGATSCGKADRLLSDGEVLPVGDFSLTVLHTPGHTPGGISLLTGKTVFVGDTLFAESIGRTDFPGGSYSQLINSIKEKLMVLDDEVKAYPGHGPATTIGWDSVVGLARLSSVDGVWGGQKAAEVVGQCSLSMTWRGIDYHPQLRRDEEFTVDGHPGWIRITDLSFTVPGIRATTEVQTVVIVQARDESYAYLSYLPDTAAHLKAALDATREGLRVAD